jgi:hypothetical protein
MMSKVNAIVVMWDPNARKVATAALRKAGLEYFAYETLATVDELADVIDSAMCKAVKVDRYFADEDDPRRAGAGVAR